MGRAASLIHLDSIAPLAYLSLFSPDYQQPMICRRQPDIILLKPPIKAAVSTIASKEKEHQTTPEPYTKA